MDKHQKRKMDEKADAAFLEGYDLAITERELLAEKVRVLTEALQQIISYPTDRPPKFTLNEVLKIALDAIKQSGNNITQS